MSDTRNDRQNGPGASPRTTYLKDYRPPAFLVDQVDLQFDILDGHTRVASTLQVRRNPDAADGALPLELYGNQLTLLRLAIDGQPLTPDRYRVEGESLYVDSPPNRFQLEVETRIEPETNTALEGLFMSHGMYCTQCEAEGFRRITYYPDRPDVMARFSTTISADRDRCPVLLSNGNPVDHGDLPDNRHWVRWEDPFPKPSYLFALVAGDLVCIEDSFRTHSGRDVALRIYVEPNNADKCDHAMASLKKAMTWDEQTFGLEYDLDIIIVAVDHFNMGAMENKGLNVFNSRYVLARPDTATDQDYVGIEGVIGHEYFHNWTGNRVTCRDWFQLSLKEGLTVFRDQEFTSDMTSRAVKRIGDVRMLRSFQFAEDSGPMAHPVRPDSYIEINNFYTLTVYEKGAELIRMIHTLIGRENFRAGMDLYFERHDGQAVTTEEFVRAMEDASGVNLKHFRLWYTQAGTPELTVAEQYDPARRQYTLRVAQATSPTPGQRDKKPLHMPLAVALLGDDGHELPMRLQGESSATTGTRILHLEDREQEFCFEDLDARPVPSLLRGFSAPVRLRMDYSDQDLAFLMARDGDPFNRWNAGQDLSIRVLLSMVKSFAAGRDQALPPHYLEAVGQLLDDRDADPSLLAEALTMPSEAYLGDEMERVDVDAIHAARESLRRQLGTEFKQALLRVYADNETGGEYRYDPVMMGQRRLRNLALGFLVDTGDTDMQDLCTQHYRQANNMTDSISALGMLANLYTEQREIALQDFYDRWQNDSLVIDKWFTSQALSKRKDAFEQVQALMQHPAFDIKTPNRVRSLVGAYCHSNPARFHAADGSGYRFLADRVLELNALNPQVAARMLGAMTRWKRYDDARQALMRAQIQRIVDTPSLSKDVYEIASKSLG